MYARAGKWSWTRWIVERVNKFEQNIFQAFESYGGYAFYDKKACVGGMTSGRLFATEFEWLIFGSNLVSQHLNQKSVILILLRKTARITCNTSFTSFSIKKVINLVSFSFRIDYSQ